MNTWKTFMCFSSQGRMLVDFHCELTDLEWFAKHSRKKNFSSHPAGRCRTLWGGQIFAIKIGYI